MAFARFVGGLRGFPFRVLVLKVQGELKTQKPLRWPWYHWASSIKRKTKIPRLGTEGPYG